MKVKEGGAMAVVRCAAGRLGVLASVAANLITLAWLIRRCYFGGGSGGSGEGRTVEASKGMPPVTHDSVVNLDQ